jgi:hypothetical protein
MNAQKANEAISEAKSTGRIEAASKMLHERIIETLSGYTNKERAVILFDLSSHLSRDITDYFKAL